MNPVTSDQVQLGQITGRSANLRSDYTSDQVQLGQIGQVKLGQIGSSCRIRSNCMRRGIGIVRVRFKVKFRVDAGVRAKGVARSDLASGSDEGLGWIRHSPVLREDLGITIH